MPPDNRHILERKLLGGNSSRERQYWSIVPYIVALLAALVGTGLVVLTDANTLLSVLAVSAPLATLLFLFHLETGLYVLLAAAMVLEQFQIFGIDNPLTSRIPIYQNLNSVTGIGPLLINSVELILISMVFFWAVRAASNKKWHFRPIPHLGLASLFLAMLLFFTLYGLGHGGDLEAALWEIRALYYLCACYFLATQLIRTQRQISICIWIIIGGVSIKGLQGCWRFFVDLNGDIHGTPAITSHEDAVFMVTVFALMAALFLLDCWKRKEFFVLACMFPPTFLTFILTQRRIAYGCLALSLIIIFSLLPRAKKLFAIKLALPLILLLAVYTGTFWNSSSTIALPIRQIRSVFEEGEETDTSNTYREIENFNMRQTIRQNPFGIGFGKKYLILIPLPYVDFPLWDYIPHNCIYWMWAKTGWMGFIIFWLFFGTIIVQTVIDYRHEINPVYQAVCLMVIAFIISQLAVAYYDLQITFYRNMIYLGIAMALPVAIRNLPESQHGHDQHER